MCGTLLSGRRLGADSNPAYDVLRLQNKVALASLAPTRLKKTFWAMKYSTPLLQERTQSLLPAINKLGATIEGYYIIERRTFSEGTTEEYIAELGLTATCVTSDTTGQQTMGVLSSGAAVPHPKFRAEFQHVHAYVHGAGGPELMSSIDPALASILSGKCDTTPPNALPNALPSDNIINWSVKLPTLAVGQHVDLGWLSALRKTREVPEDFEYALESFDNTLRVKFVASMLGSNGRPVYSTLRVEALQPVAFPSVIVFTVNEFTIRLTLTA